MLWRRSDNVVFALLLGGAGLVAVGDGVECQVRGILQVSARCGALLGLPPPQSCRCGRLLRGGLAKLAQLARRRAPSLIPACRPPTAATFK